MLEVGFILPVAAYFRSTFVYIAFLSIPYEPCGLDCKSFKNSVAPNCQILEELLIDHPRSLLIQINKKESFVC